MKKKFTITIIMLTIIQLISMNGFSIANNAIYVQTKSVINGEEKINNLGEIEGESNKNEGSLGEIIGESNKNEGTFGEIIGESNKNDIPCQHQYNDATCTTPKKCKLCGATIGNALGHDYSSEKIIKLGNCTEGSEFAKKCSRCELVDYNRIKVEPPMGHIRGEKTIIKHATCTEGGIEQYNCLVCSQVAETKQTSSLGGHIMDNGVCTRCGEKEKTLSTNYTIENNYIIGIKPGATIEEIKNNITSTTKYEITKPDGSQIQSNENVGTGCKIQFTTGESYTIVVTGDVDGDGKITLIDLVRIKKHIAEITQLQGEYKKAADIKKDEEINITDMAQMKKAIVGLIQL